MDQSIPKASRLRRSRQQILDLLALFEKSNLTVKDFSEKHHVHPANFHKWKSRYGGKNTGKIKSTGFATLNIVAGPSTHSPGLFAEVKGIKIYQPVSASFLKELLA